MVNNKNSKSLNDSKNRIFENRNLHILRLRFLNKNYLLFLILLLVDQLTKLWIILAKPAFDIKILAFTYVQNTGAIWGSLQNSNNLLIWISIIAIGVLMYMYDKIQKKAYFFYIMIFAGIIGNLIDRIFRGFVVDFIDFKFWPIFNFADSFIVIGVIGLIVFLWKNEK